MSKTITKLLTATGVDAAPAAAKGSRDEYRDRKVGGLVLRVTDTGAKSYALYARFPPDNVPSRVKLRDASGDSKIALAAARRKALAWLELIENGVDPREQEEKERREAQHRRRV